ncbi:amidohydrolase [Rhizobiales bacterium]|jgi:aminobenzoyl-glutamate utilization protein B|uniref:amidohydrolase n=1 Tax=Rhizobium sp. 11_C7_N12_5 TaxID=3240770 RepID=UPI0013AE8AB3
MLQAGKIMAASAVRALTDPTLVIAAKTEHRKQLDGEKYASLIPAEAAPQRLRLR